MGAASARRRRAEGDRDLARPRPPAESSRPAWPTPRVESRCLTSAPRRSPCRGAPAPFGPTTPRATNPRQWIKLRFSRPVARRRPRRGKQPDSTVARGHPGGLDSPARKHGYCRDSTSPGRADTARVATVARRGGDCAPGSDWRTRHPTTAANTPISPSRLSALARPLRALPPPSEGMRWLRATR